MQIAIPKEIKNHEYRITLTPTGARELVARGHQVTIQAGADAGAGFSDADYTAADAHLQADGAKVWDGAELILKVKEPQAEDVHFAVGLNVHDGQVTYAAVAEAFGLESLATTNLLK